MGQPSVDTVQKRSLISDSVGCETGAGHRKRKSIDMNLHTSAFDISKRQKSKQFVAPIMHSVPKSILPILHEPLKPDDLFADIDYQVIDADTSKHIERILKKFPPPIPPYLNKDIDNGHGGLMIPFIYPPPVIDNTSLLSNQDSEKQINSGSANKGKPEKRFIELPPLPFPPPNYIPYPLVSAKSTLCPSEAFDALLKASKELPRVDMVVASAAGSLFSLKAQAGEEGITTNDYEEIKRRVTHESQYESEKELLSSGMDSEIEYENQEAELKEYYSNIDRSEEYDPFDKPKNRDSFELTRHPNHEFLKFEYIKSDLRNGNMPIKTKGNHDLHAIPDDFPRNLSSFTARRSSYLSNPNKDVAFANGSNKEKRRQALVKSLEEIETFEKEHREEIFQIREQEILNKIKKLQNSKISLSGLNDSIEDEELLRFKNKFAEIRDKDLVMLNLFHKYETFKNLTNFYQSSNKVFKSHSVSFLNKFARLKNFFEYQKQSFEALLDDVESKESFTDIKSKDSSKIYANISDRDYHKEIKQLLRGKDDKKMDHNSSHVQPTNYVNEFTPLATSEEFEIITGWDKSKLSKDHKAKVAEDMKNNIFSGPLYDAVTSGSESNNTSENNPGVGSSKRRGRRGNKDEEKSSKYSESELLARIMKHFTGPGGASTEELNTDLEMLNLKTRWPVSHSK